MTRARDIASGADFSTGIDAGEVLPHIIPGVLYPAVAGKLLDGSTSHSGNYGTAQNQTGGDGRMYYYTDIKGSKPIKDPRIGAHFGSQRHKFKSLQLLEQETATHGSHISSIDGREWARTISSVSTEPSVQNDGSGLGLVFDPATANEWIEITGYFNQANLLAVIWSNSSQDVNIYIDGADSGNNVNVDAAVNNPLGSRFVDSCSVVNMDLGSISLGIHTLKIGGTTTYWYPSGIELIAQDTTSTANKSKIQIPSQNVVSYGKKFTVSGTPHYDPFNGFTNSSDLHSAFVDTATSLGLDSAPGSSAKWAISSTNNIRPYNGGRVVIWVDSSGTIKTSVNMMPPNAQNIAGSNAGTTEVTTPSATNATYTPIFSDDAIDHSLSEIAKTFHWREFGNGAANEGSSASGTKQDASMLSSADDISYVMDDGLTSLSAGGAVWNSSENFKLNNTADKVYITFIGTGLTIINGTGTIRNVAQNLPYGTHIFRIERTSSSAGTATIDGIAVQSTHANWDRGIIWSDISFHQPKKPPIPEDAVVLADYMLMADFVAQTTASTEHISKGVRRISSSRDFFYDSSSTVTGFFSSTSTYPPDRMSVGGSQALTIKLPVFGTRMSINVEDVDQSDHGTNWAGTDTESSNTKVQGSSNGLDILITPVATLGTNLINQTAKGGNHYFSGMTVATPIHTSHHYQSFETPFLHELVGGDRNMEQHNLVVTPDGKTWDEVTRDTSYIGNVVVSATTDTETDDPTMAVLDDWRGLSNGTNYFNKDFAIAYDRLICLKDGQYQAQAQGRSSGHTGEHLTLKVNGASVYVGYMDSAHSIFNVQAVMTLKRGDYFQLQGEFGVSNSNYNQFSITRL